MGLILSSDAGTPAGGQRNRNSKPAKAANIRSGCRVFPDISIVNGMEMLTPQNALDYARQSGLLTSTESGRVDALAWGVSNAVLRVTPDRGEAFVIKQSRPQLRTPDPWFSRLDRVWREADAMRCLVDLLPAGVVPRVLFEDRDNYLFAMEAAPAEHTVWKQRLLEGTVERRVAEFLGDCLAAMHRETAFRGDLHRQFGDTEVFVQLRVDPFYRRVAAVAPEARAAIDQMIDEMFATAVCLVHADFSPKNVLVAGERTVLVDYETAHYGDPAFDLGFFLSHLLLKTLKHRARFSEFAGLTTAFWGRYWSGLQPLSSEPPFAKVQLHRRTVGHLAGCMWARIDGSSKIDYLPEPGQQELVRVFCRRLLAEPPADWPALLARLHRMAGDGTNTPIEAGA